MTAYLQTPVEPSGVQKTATTFPFGLYEFVRMAYGLKNAVQTFQRFMDKVTRALPFIFAYLDEILLATGPDEEQKKYIRMLFERLDEHDLV